MADNLNLIEISELQPTTELKSADIIPLVQDGKTRSIKGAVLEQNLLNKTNERYIKNTEKGQYNGVATLDSEGKLKESQRWKVEINSQIQPIDLSTEVPKENGVFQPIEVGVYPNFGNLELTQEEKDTSTVYFFLLDGIFSKEVKIISTTEIIEPNVTLPIQSKSVYDWSIRNVATIEDLREIQGFDGQKINLLGYYKAGDKNPIIYDWVYDIAEDDGGSVIVPNKGGGYWEAQFVDSVNVRDFGAKCNGVDDDYNYITKSLIFSKKVVFSGKSKVSRKITLDGAKASQINLIASDDFTDNSVCEIKKCDIDSIYVDGNNKNVYGIILHDKNKLKDVSVINTGNIGILDNSESNGTVIHGLKLSNNGFLNIPKGWAGVRAEKSNFLEIINIKADNQFGKVISFSECKNCSIYNFKSKDINTPQAIIYFARGNNNKAKNVEIINSEASIKFSRQENGSLLSDFYINNEDIENNIGYAGIILQGTENCELNNGIIINRVKDCVVIESHPIQSGDPFSENGSINNSLNNVSIFNKNDLGASVRITNRSDTPNMKTEYNSLNNCSIDGGVNNLLLLRSIKTNLTNSKFKNNGKNNVSMQNCSLNIDRCFFECKNAIVFYIPTISSLDLKNSNIEHESDSNHAFISNRQADTLLISNNNINSTTTRNSSLDIRNMYYLMMINNYIISNKALYLESSLKRGIFTGNTTNANITMAPEILGTNYTIPSL